MVQLCYKPLLENSFSHTEHISNLNHWYNSLSKHGSSKFSRRLFLQISQLKFCFMEDISTVNEYRLSSVPCARTSYICKKMPSHWWYLEVTQAWELLQAGGSIKVMQFSCDWKEPLMKISYVGTREQGTNKHNKGQTSTQLLHTTALKELLFICPGKSQSTLKRNKRSKLVNCRSKEPHLWNAFSNPPHFSMEAYWWGW